MRTLCPFRLYNDCLYYERMHPLHRARYRCCSPPGHGARRARGHHRYPRTRHRLGLRAAASIFPGGLTRVATIVDSLKALYPGAVVVMDAGDMRPGRRHSQPTLPGSSRMIPHPLIEAMNLTGYDVATLGDHEFDWGWPRCGRPSRGAPFPMSAATSTRWQETPCCTHPTSCSGAQGFGSVWPASPRPA